MPTAEELKERVHEKMQLGSLIRDNDVPCELCAHMDGKEPDKHPCDICLFNQTYSGQFKSKV